MFARVVALLPLALVVSAASLPARTTTSNTVNQCNTGHQMCCNQKFETTQALANVAGLSILDLLIATASQKGIACSGGSITTCVQQPTCCTNVEQTGLINIACSPVAV